VRTSPLAGLSDFIKLEVLHEKTLLPRSRGDAGSHEDSWWGRGSPS
jgi:hypothetical protein